MGVCTSQECRVLYCSAETQYGSLHHPPPNPPTGAGEVPISTRLILSSHDFERTPPRAELHAKAAAMRAAGADIVKIAAMANDIGEAADVLSLLQEKSGAAMGGLLGCGLEGSAAAG